VNAAELASVTPRFPEPFVVPEPVTMCVLVCCAPVVLNGGRPSQPLSTLRTRGAGLETAPKTLKRYFTALLQKCTAHPPT
jgi:hypothetical protein